MAAQILYSIALGPPLSATLSFVNSSPSSSPKYDSHHGGNDHSAPTAYIPSQQYQTDQPSYTPLTIFPLGKTHKKPSHFLTGFLRLLHPVIVVALVLGILSGIDRAPSSDGTLNKDRYDRGATFAKASAALFLLVPVGISIGVAFMFRHRKVLPRVASYIITAMPVIIPLLFLRVLYSLLAAANLDTTDHGGHTTRYNVLSGSWAVYLVLGLIPQGLVLLVYTVCGVGAWWNERKEIRY
jgi:cytochrome c biogenesis protein CcdA